MKYYQYKIISDYDIDYLEEEINRLAQDSWQLYGNLATNLNVDGKIVFTQPMIKYINHPGATITKM